MKTDKIDDMKPEALKKYLKKLITRLDELDEDDFFGTEGWRKFLLNKD